jgi:hypothetical protein
VNIELNELVFSKRYQPAERSARAYRAERIGRNRAGRNARPKMMRRYDPLHTIDHASVSEGCVQRGSSFDEQRDDVAPCEPGQHGFQVPSVNSVNDNATLSQPDEPRRVRVDHGLTHDHYDRPGKEGRKHAGIGRHAAPPIEDDACERRETVGPSRGELGVVDEDGSRADRDRIDLGSLPMEEAVSRRASERQAAVDASDETITRCRDLGDHEGSRLLDPREERGELTLGGFPTHAFDHLDAVRSQIREPLASDLWIAIARRGDDPSNTRRSNPFNAWTGPSNVAAGFERAVERAGPRAVAGAIERDDFGVRASRAKMRTLADHDAVGVHDDRADDGVR